MVKVTVRYERSPGGSRDSYTTLSADMAAGMAAAANLLNGCAGAGWGVLRVTVEAVPDAAGRP
jgi:hypothetical protein